jgi:vitamin B12 transporter
LYRAQLRTIHQNGQAGSAGNVGGIPKRGEIDIAVSLFLEKHHKRPIGMNASCFLTTATAFFLCSLSTAAISEDQDLALFFQDTTMVETASRHPKTLVEVAENLSLVTAAQIKAMNAHTLYEVLNRVPGLYLFLNGSDFGSSGSVNIHGSLFEDEHRLVVLLDGVRLNNPSNGIAQLNGIPVAIIDRLEIIKGPASSTWGSAIGGVINIITKKPALSEKPTAQVAVSYGKANSHDLRVEVEGAGAGPKYYLYTGNQHSDGLRGNRYFDNSQLFGKAILELSTDSKLTFSAGANKPEWKDGDFAILDERFTSGREYGFTAVNVDYTLLSSVSLHLDVSLATYDQTNEGTVFGTGLLGTAGDPFLHQNWQEQRATLGGRLVYDLSRQVIVVGGEAWHEQTDYHLALGPAAINLYGLPEEYRANRMETDNYAVFANDSLRLAELTLIPGIRYDNNSISGGFVSPSLGATYPLAPTTRLRATLARGFSLPFTSLLKEVTPFSTSNPGLDPEEVWSLQAGVETKTIPVLLVKTAAFYHDIDEVWGFAALGKIVNKGHSRRNGLEVELETVPWYNLTFGGSLAYTYDRPEQGEADDFSKGTVKAGYTNSALFNAELFGSYVHWLDAATFRGEGDNFIWDLNVARNVAMGDRTNVDVFMTLHNITDADQYWHVFYQNPGRWIEVGLRFYF